MMLLASPMVRIGLPLVPSRSQVSVRPSAWAASCRPSGLIAIHRVPG